VAEPLKVEYDKQDIRLILRAFKAMDAEATDQAKKVSSELAEFAAGKVRAYAAGSRYVGSTRVADNVKVSKSSKIGEFAYGYKSQRVFSGGASTLDMLGLEFGSNQYPQFPPKSPRLGRGSAGYFIYPTLRRIQPEIIKKWEAAFTKILKEFG
jgi:hypothetical protein